jgi:hypothetical protein
LEIHSPELLKAPPRGLLYPVLIKERWYRTPCPLHPLTHRLACVQVVPPMADVQAVQAVLAQARSDLRRSRADEAARHLALLNIHHRVLSSGAPPSPASIVQAPVDLADHTAELRDCKLRLMVRNLSVWRTRAIVRGENLP